MNEYKPVEPHYNFHCRKCGSKNVWYYLKESYDGAHEDYFYDCRDCNHKWVAEGSDY